jgi:hypothetical protein
MFCIFAILWLLPVRNFVVLQRAKTPNEFITLSKGNKQQNIKLQPKIGAQNKNEFRTFLFFVVKRLR